MTGEHVVRVRSLATPDRSGDARGSRRHRRPCVCSAIAPTTRAPSCTGTIAQWAAVGEICRRVDGIPLAIELAAARTVSMNPIDIAGHLDERFRLLTGKRRGRIERHQTLRATVEWSYQLLGRRGTAGLRSSGDVRRRASTRLPPSPSRADDELDEWAVTDALASLVGKSMIQTDTGPEGAIRYTMLETLRQYAREQLDEARDTDRCRRALARHPTLFARDVGVGVMGTDDATVVGPDPCRRRQRPRRDRVGARLRRSCRPGARRCRSSPRSPGSARTAPTWGSTRSPLQALPLAERSAARAPVDRAPPRGVSPLATRAMPTRPESSMERALEDGVITTLGQPARPLRRARRRSRWLPASTPGRSS